MVRVLPSIFPCQCILASALLIAPFFTFSQNLKCRTIAANIPVLLDSVLVEPGSIYVAAPFTYAQQTRTIVVKSSKDSVKVCYRVLSEILTKPMVARDIQQYDDTRVSDEFYKPNEVSRTIEKEDLFDFGQVNKYGAITRGVSFGNRQSLFVNSSLNLQMNGKLDENLFLTASITDQNVPYQPEGNTQQVRDFDNVFIKIHNDRFDLTAGDIVLQQPFREGYFLKYYKNIQGLQVRLRGEAMEGWNYKSGASGALSKGKFNSAIVEAIDGLNGPYRLRGPNGERFIIILANSEKVFLDGKLLERGFDRDYVIDYNLGEVTFNNHIVITQFSIIRIDYEYSEQFYNRSNFSAYQKLSKEKVSIYANYYREKDNPNTNLGFSLNDDDLQDLNAIGDQSDQAFVASFDSVQFSENRVLYIQKDTIDADGGPQTIFVNSTDASQELFSPTFSEVGDGMGNYVLSEATANGRVYQWVSPQGGVPQGNFEPGAFIPLPNKRQLFTIGASTHLSEYESLKVEGAFSERDDNLYSRLEDDDNAGQALFTTFSTKGRPSFLPEYHWQGSISTEYDQRDFTFIDRYRPILFERDWNFNLAEAENANDFILSGQVGLEKDQSNRFVFSVNRRKRSDQIDGWQQGLQFNHEVGNFHLRTDHFRLNNEQSASITKWIRSKSDLSFNRWKVVPGVIYELDKNEVSVQDSITSTLMNFQSQEFYVTNSDSTRSKFRFAYKARRDALPVEGELQDYLFSRNLTGSYALNGKKGRVVLDLNYRTVDDKLGVNDIQDEIINGRINWSQQFWKRLFSHKFSYATGNSRELRREFVYLPVNTGEGTHTWRDTNGDGVQDLNEFFEAINPDERNFVKIFTPTDDYIVAFQTIYLHTMDLRMPLTWRNSGAFLKTLSKISVNLNFNVNYKTTSASYDSRLNPFGVDLANESIIAAQDIRRYTLFYNRNGRGFAADFTRQTQDNKQLLTQGFEIRQNDQWLSNFKVDLSSEYTLRVTSSLGRQLNESDFLESRNFEIISNSFQPQLIWQPNNQFRLIGSFERKDKRNDLMESSEEEVTTNAYSGEFIWNQASKGSLRATVSFIGIDFQGDPSNYLGYLLLDGLQAGTNQTWQVNWQHRLSKGMQLSLLYNGRKSEEQEAIHTGSVQVTAFF